MENENMVAQQKKKSPIMGILISIILIAGAGVLGWYIGQMNSSEVLKEKTECEEKLTLSKTTETETVKESKSKCYGTYIESGTEGQVKWILKDDGTFKVEDPAGLKELSGAFFIKDNTITFIEHKHTVGPEDQDPYYTNPQTNLISKDCKNITLGTGEIRAGLTRQD